ncbi:hypothetical protein XBFM1_1720013 [Xenorhabdus bovienii str. feltiae Moldova]|uniref:Uncharacterized protein n=1 Tax=Xenorhabdus bovienii str. feltiae Moldova TaxID=1398200 RepID=A0A077NNU2_XENBV|nr:hypothetical protein XBFM1_1720013 [Xenorhabdus bovienii str. feltiae Moldova]
MNDLHLFYYLVISEEISTILLGVYNLPLDVISMTVLIISDTEVLFDNFNLFF